MSSNEERIPTLLRQVFEGHRSRLQGYKILLFGSRATGKAGERSDFDIGIIGDRPISLKAFYAIEEELENLPTLYRID
ncbi:nucleotidyltransferase family protein, partial [Methylohalobius crimeensis]|uniref:nucleotidyltransferase family protein n=1 Tax=Methylohalobius crimeensis TaxID=244365 RepID=UPI00041931E9